MSYQLALAKAHLDLENLTEEKKFSVKLLSDEYEVDLENRRILSLSCNTQAKPYVAILILHYLLKKIKVLPKIKGEWISFRNLPGGEGYFLAFKKRAIEPILRKYKDSPLSLYEVLGRFNGRKAEFSDVSIIVEVLREVPFLITLQREDEEFPAEANLLFDKSIEEIFSTEDIVVLAEFVARNI